MPIAINKMLLTTKIISLTEISYRINSVYFNIFRSDRSRFIFI